MDAERWKRVDELLQAALQAPAEHREELLRRECAGDAELLGEFVDCLRAFGLPESDAVVRFTRATEPLGMR